MTENPDGTFAYDNLDEVPADVPVVHAADIMDALTGLDDHDGLLDAIENSPIAVAVDNEQDMLALLLLQSLPGSPLAPYDPR